MRRWRQRSPLDASQTLTPGLWLGVVVLGCLLAMGARACPPEGELQVARVQRVIDGDTLVLEGLGRLRLIGIDTPELGRDGAPHEPYAEAARDRLQALLPLGEQVYWQQGSEPRDRYGRLLGHVFAGSQGPLLSAELLRSGLGLHATVPPNVRYQACLAHAEATARRLRRGGWETDAWPVVPAAQVEAGGFQRVRARVLRVESGAGAWWLETGEGVVWRLSRDDLPAFEAANAPGFDPRAWQGRELTVRGWVVDRGERTRADRARFLMPLRHPAMLEQ